MERYCDDRGVVRRQSGKVIVATSAREMEALVAMEQRGRDNDVVCERIGPARLASIEPAIRGLGALWVPEAGVVDYREVCRRLAEDLIAAGGEVWTGVDVRRVREEKGSVLVEAKNRDTRRFDAAVCAAGLWSDRLAERSSDATAVTEGVHILPFRGEYHALAPKAAAQIRGLVYPVPDPRFPFLGVHLTRHIDDIVTAGPNAVPALARDGYGWGKVRLRDVFGSATSPGMRRLLGRYPKAALGELRRSLDPRAFLRSAQQLMPTLTLDDLEPHRSGVRAQAVAADGTLLDDFQTRRCGRILHVLNAPSPAATASLAIAERLVVELLGPQLSTSTEDTRWWG